MYTWKLRNSWALKPESFNVRHLAEIQAKLEEMKTQRVVLETLLISMMRNMLA